jgi:hypothetical protein
MHYKGTKKIEICKLFTNYFSAVSVRFLVNNIEVANPEIGRKVGKWTLSTFWGLMSTFLLFPPEDTLTAMQVAKTFNMTVYDFNAVLRDMGIPSKTATHSEKAL